MVLFESRGFLRRYASPVLFVALACTLVLIAKSVLDFSHSGPQIAAEISRQNWFCG